MNQPERTFDADRALVAHCAESARAASSRRILTLKGAEPPVAMQPGYDSPGRRLKALQLALSAPPTPFAIAGPRVYAGGGGIALAHDLSETLKALKAVVDTYADKDAGRRKRARVLENARKLLGMDE